MCMFVTLKFISLLPLFGGSLTGFDSGLRTQDSRSCGSGARTRFELDTTGKLRELRNSGTGLKLGITGLRPVENYETPVENYETPVENYETPVENYETPVENYETPVEYYETPVENYETPVENFKPVITKFAPSC